MNRMAEMESEDGLRASLPFLSPVAYRRSPGSNGPGDDDDDDETPIGDPDDDDYGDDDDEEDDEDDTLWTRGRAPVR